MTIEAVLDDLVKAVNANTENPGMFATIERLIKALDRNTNVHLASGTTAKDTVEELRKMEKPSKAPAEKAEKKADAEKKAEAAKPVKATDKIEYATLAKKGLAVIDLKGREYFAQFLSDNGGLANLKQAHVDDYTTLNEALDRELA